METSWELQQCTSEETADQLLTDVIIRRRLKEEYKCLEI